MKKQIIKIQNVFDWASSLNEPYNITGTIIPPWENALYVYRVMNMLVTVHMSLFDDVALLDKKYEKLWHCIDPETRYVVDLNLFLGKHNMGHYVLPLLENGTSAGGVLYLPTDYALECLETVENRYEYEQLLINYSSICLLANSFAHCRNVELIDEPLTRQQRRMLERRGGIRHKVLAIEPFKKQVRKEIAGTSEGEISRALHICRGHFATYTEDNPLFGKHTGTFWRAQHVRGNKSAGIVEKDYTYNMRGDG